MFGKLVSIELNKNKNYNLCCHTATKSFLSFKGRISHFFGFLALFSDVLCPTESSGTLKSKILKI